MTSCVRINAPHLQKLDPNYEMKLVNKAVELYMNSPTLKRGRYTNTTTRYSEIEVASAQEKSSDLFLPISSATSIPEAEKELLGDVEFVGNISDSSSDVESVEESDGHSDSEEESGGQSGED